ncbi:hypothetical protein [Parafrankia sp. EUN1f]|uniref:hypothetical protein n=1 Tax=Parafrankia sp. EUN1f TaxID=102897 RepID=UPI001E446174|nr:hypothetical protein [Parafrankia sp. EUN1f]
MLASFSVTLLPAGLALTADRAPRRLRARIGPVRPVGWGVLLIYAAAPVDTVPRLAGASLDVIFVCSTAGGVLCLAGALLGRVSIYRYQSRATDGPWTAS